jgi:hypothetical protein
MKDDKTKMTLNDGMNENLPIRITRRKFSVSRCVEVVRSSFGSSSDMATVFHGIRAERSVFLFCFLFSANGGWIVDPGS